MHSRPSGLATFLALLALPAAALASVTPPLDMADLSIEDLANIAITSVSKKPQRLAVAAAAVFVITADDIRRAGAVNIPDALRLAPNLQVGQLSTYGYAISARGMNGSNNSAPNKLLVMIDGRSVYAPLFSGVYWDVQDVVLEDIERIEVISGPGGTLWGVNAVNGVINITTRRAADTRASLLSVLGGERGAVASFRQGGGSADSAWLVYGKYVDLRHTALASGARVDDARQQSQVGFRADVARGADQFSVHGNAFASDSEQAQPGAISAGQPLVLGPLTSSGVNLTGAWMRTLADGGQLSLQGYLDHSKRRAVPTYAETLDIADLQFQYAMAASGPHTVVWGANLRTSWDDVDNSATIAFLPAKTRQNWASVFVQDDVALGETLRLTVGARVEHNPYTGKEWLPTARLAWTPSPTQMLWTGLSRTVRAPSRLDADAFIPGQPPYLLRGGPTVRAEVARVLELGYRAQPAEGMSFSVTAFHNDYDHLRTQEIDPTFTFITFGSLMEGKSHGIELWGSYQVAPWWRLNAGLMGLHERFTLKPGSNDEAGPGSARKDPSHTAQLRSSFNLADNKDLDLMLRKVGALGNPAVPGYTALDARLAWRPRRNLEISLLGQNLTGSHGEYGPAATRAQLGRTLALKLVWQD